MIVHPGIKGDRGPSSLDWAIVNDEKSWGVSILEAADKFDAGPIWAAHEFALGRSGVAFRFGSDCAFWRRSAFPSHRRKTAIPLPGPQLPFRAHPGRSNEKVGCLKAAARSEM